MLMLPSWSAQDVEPSITTKRTVIALRHAAGTDAS
jgi:hypothetical protein